MANFVQSNFNDNINLDNVKYIKNDHFYFNDGTEKKMLMGSRVSDHIFKIKREKYDMLKHMENISKSVESMVSVLNRMESACRSLESAYRSFERSKENDRKEKKKRWWTKLREKFRKNSLIK